MNNFPTLQQITEIKYIYVYYKGEFQYIINTEIQINNLRIWAFENNETENITFVWEGLQIDINNNGDLTKYPKGFLDTEQKQMAKMVRLRRERYD
jgi:hypothetical protein